MSIEIEQDDEWRRIEAPDYSEDIISGGMGPCVSVFIYEADTKITYACHYSSPDIQFSELITGMVDEAFKEFGSNSKVKIFVSGAVDGEEGSTEKRDFVEKLIQERFHPESDVNFLWPKPGTKTIELVFDPADGVLHEPKT